MEKKEMSGQARTYGGCANSAPHHAVMRRNPRMESRGCCLMLRRKNWRAKGPPYIL